MRHIEIIGAMEEELMGLRATHADAAWRDQVTVRRSGVGKVNAALAVAEAQRCNAQRIIAVGTAGALAPELRIGDVVVVDRAVQHDVDASPVGFPRGTIPFETTSEWHAFPELVPAAERAARELGFRTVTGGICSGERFIADPTEKAWLHEHFGGLCTDMETGAVAQACTKLNIPWVSIRIISDGADHGAAVDFAASLALASDRIARIIRDLFNTRC